MEILISMRGKNAIFRTHFIQSLLAEKKFLTLFLIRIKAFSKKIHCFSEFARKKKKEFRQNMGDTMIIVALQAEA